MVIRFASSVITVNAIDADSICIGMNANWIHIKKTFICIYRYSVSTVLMSSSPTQTWQHLASHLASITPHLRSSKNISLLTKIHPRSKLSAHIRTKQIHFDSCDNDLYSTAALVTSVMGLTLEAIEREQATEIFTNLFTLVSTYEIACVIVCMRMFMFTCLRYLCFGILKN